MYQKGELINMEAQRNCVLCGMQFQVGDHIVITLRKRFLDDRDPGLGAGGPWGWGGYTSRYVRSLAERISAAGIEIFRRDGE